jgi:hypothetical protein
VIVGMVLLPFAHVLPIRLSAGAEHNVPRAGCRPIQWTNGRCDHKGMIVIQVKQI